MRTDYIENLIKDKNIRYRGTINTRLNNLTDAVFGIAVTLLIFNIADANSFTDLLVFAKSFPALLVSIIFIYIIWKEHVSFVVVYGIHGFTLQMLNVVFISFIIFYVYPLRFLTRLLTNLFFDLEIELNIEGHEIPNFMIFYGLIAFAIYFVLYLFYLTVQKQELNLNEYELFYTKAHGKRILLMAIVPLISLTISFILKNYSIIWASVLGGSSYGLYPILMQLWSNNYKRKKINMLKPEANRIDD